MTMAPKPAPTRTPKAPARRSGSKAAQVAQTPVAQATPGKAAPPATPAKAAPKPPTPQEVAKAFIKQSAGGAPTTITDLKRAVAQSGQALDKEAFKAAAKGVVSSMRRGRVGRVVSFKTKTGRVIKFRARK